MTLVSGRTFHVMQGEHCVSDEPGAMMTTVLGSCVAACLHDPLRGIGGMNHFLLPDDGASRDIRHASAAMERLVNSLIKQGASRDRLQAKLFGGSRMIAGLPDVGRRNGEAAMAFLRSEGIVLLAHSLGGREARRVRFWPASGRAQQMLLPSNQVAHVAPAPGGDFGPIELF